MFTWNRFLQYASLFGRRRTSFLGLVAAHNFHFVIAEYKVTLNNNKINTYEIIYYH